MNADRVGPDRQRLAADQRQPTVAGDRKSLVGGGARIVDKGIRMAARPERAIGLIEAVGKCLGRDRQASGATRVQESRTSQADEDEVGGDSAHRPGDGGGHALVAGGPVVERPMRLDVAKIRASRTGERGDRPDLVHDRRLKVGRSHLQIAASESREIRVAGVGADGHAGSHGAGHRPLDDERVAGVKPAGNVDRRDERDESVIVADLPGSEALADVGVEVDRHGSMVRAEPVWRPDSDGACLPGSRAQPAPLVPPLAWPEAEIGARGRYLPATPFALVRGGVSLPERRRAGQQSAPPVVPRDGRPAARDSSLRHLWCPGTTLGLSQDRRPRLALTWRSGFVQTLDKLR